MLAVEAPRVHPNLDRKCDAWPRGVLLLERSHPNSKRVCPWAHGILRVRLTAIA